MSNGTLLNKLWDGGRPVPSTESLIKNVSYGKLVTYMNDRTSHQSVRQIRLTEIPGV